LDMVGRAAAGVASPAREDSTILLWIMGWVVPAIAPRWTDEMYSSCDGGFSGCSWESMVPSQFSDGLEREFWKPASWHVRLSRLGEVMGRITAVIETRPLQLSSRKRFWDCSWSAKSKDVGCATRM
jgi:hypothetical protein